MTRRSQESATSWARPRPEFTRDPGSQPSAGRVGSRVARPRAPDHERRQVCPSRGCARGRLSSPRRLRDEPVPCDAATGKHRAVGADPGARLEDRSAVVLEPLLGAAEKVVVGEGDFRCDETIVADGRDRRDVGVRFDLASRADRRPVFDRDVAANDPSRRRCCCSREWTRDPRSRHADRGGRPRTRLPQC